MRSFSIAALVGTVAAAPAIIFSANQAPHCEVLDSGATSVHYTDSMHPSFKCTHTSATTCVCSNPHPTHHTGGCKEFDHSDGTTHSVDGDCTDSGINSVDGAWSGWTASGSCSAACGDGLQTYTRTCDGIVNGGADCSGLDGGSTTKTESCKIKECPVHGAWSDWTVGSCSASCGDGTKTSTRTCEGKAHGGNDCSGLDGGSATKTESCKIKDCVTYEWRLERFNYGKSVGHGSHNAAHSAESAFCVAQGGRLPTYQELCPNYNAGSRSGAALGCENSHSWMPYSTNSNNWMYVGCTGTGGHHECKDHVTHHGNPGWGSGDQYGIMLDCMVHKPVRTLTLQRFYYGKSGSTGQGTHDSHATAHMAEEAFCKAKGGRLPTYQELCPNYNSGAASTPALGCENSHSWMPYAGGSNNWMYVGCPGTGSHHMCKDHMTHHGLPGWSSGDQYGTHIDCWAP